MKKIKWKQLLVELAKAALMFFLGKEVTDPSLTLSIGVIGSAAIAAGTSLLGTAGSAVASGKLNRKTRKWNEKMWNLQNEYNLPENQLMRMRAAGLNPHLMYGQGTVGNADKPMSWSPDMPDMSGIASAGSKGIDTYYAAQMKAGQIDKLKTENAILATQLESQKIDLGVKEKLTNVMVPDSNLGAGISTRNMLYEGALAGLNEKRSRADIARISNVVADRTMNAQIDQKTASAVNEAAKKGLIDAQTANTLTGEKLRSLEAQLKEWEVNFMENSNLRSGDLIKILPTIIPAILRGMMKN